MEWPTYINIQNTAGCVPAELCKVLRPLLDAGQRWATHDVAIRIAVCQDTAATGVLCVVSMILQSVSRIQALPNLLSPYLGW
jgi:hypothetical protein